MSVMASETRMGVRSGVGARVGVYIAAASGLRADVGLLSKVIGGWIATSLRID